MRRQVFGSGIETGPESSRARIKVARIRRFRLLDANGQAIAGGPDDMAIGRHDIR